MMNRQTIKRYSKFIFYAIFFMILIFIVFSCNQNIKKKASITRIDPGTEPPLFFVVMIDSEELPHLFLFKHCKFVNNNREQWKSTRTDYLDRDKQGIFSFQVVDDVVLLNQDTEPFFLDETKLEHYKKVIEEKLPSPFNFINIEIQHIENITGRQLVRIDLISDGSFTSIYETDGKRIFPVKFGRFDRHNVFRELKIAMKRISMLIVVIIIWMILNKVLFNKSETK